MNIGFINPPSEFLTDQRVFMSLGILRIATQVKEYIQVHDYNKYGTNYKVNFLDLSNQHNYNNLISNFINNNNLDVICLTSTTPHISIVYKFCKYIKKNFNIKIILGGPHVTLMYSSQKQGTPYIQNICNKHFKNLYKYVDSIVIGDGEIALFDALKFKENLINAEENKNLFIGENYDKYAIADRKFLDIESYHYYIDGKKATNIISQIGCPYKCSFCSGRDSKSFNHIKKRSIENIMKEIEMLHKTYGFEGFMFYDDEINLNKEYFEKFLNTLILYQKENNVEFALRGFTRANLLTDEQAKLMYKAGFRWLLIGFESGSNKILENMNKGCTVEDNTKSFNIARNNNLKVKALMSVGHPGESQETIRESIEWIKKVKPDETDITIISVYPGSHYFDKSIKFNDNTLMFENIKTKSKLYIKNIDFLKDANFYKSKSNEYVSYVYTDFLTSEQLVENRLKFEQEIKNLK
ncbi:radical SAM protein [bacterium]|jgi:radical SAM superfamily enzyme YgiQ (UPF0313 family)|nr:radical SAM protein [bacterium]